MHHNRLYFLDSPQCITQHAILYLIKSNNEAKTETVHTNHYKSHQKPLTLALN